MMKGLPFTLVADSIFSRLAADLLDGLDPGAIAEGLGTQELTLIGFVVVLVLGGIAAFYAMLVVAPRQLADPEDAGFRWVVRFALFLVAMLTGISWISILA